MDKRKLLRNCTIILTFLILLIDVALYFKLQGNWAGGSADHPYERFSLLLVSMIQYGAFVYGLILVLGVWIEYFLICLLMKVCNKFCGFKKWLLCSILLFVVIGLTVLIIKFGYFIFVIYLRS